MKLYKSINNGQDFSNIEIGLLKSILRDFPRIELAVIEEWVNTVKDMNISDNFLDKLIDSKKNRNYGNNCISDDFDKILDNGAITTYGEKNLDEVQQKLAKAYDNEKTLEKLFFFLKFQKIYKTAWGSTKAEYINPLFSRIEQTLNSLESLIKIVDNEEIGRAHV